MGPPGKKKKKKMEALSGKAYGKETSKAKRTFVIFQNRQGSNKEVHNNLNKAYYASHSAFTRWF